MSFNLMLEMSRVHTLPLAALRVLAAKPAMLGSLCSRSLLPEELWFELWEKSKNNYEARTDLVARLLTKKQVEVCLEEVLSDTELTGKFLLYNSAPKDRLNDFFRDYLYFPGQTRYNFIMGGSLSTDASKELLLKDGDRHHFQFLEKILCWYAFRSGEETTDQEIFELLKELAAHEDYDTYNQSVGAPLGYLFSRRPQLAAYFNDAVKIDSKFHRAILHTEAIHHVEAKTLNRWFNNSDPGSVNLENAYKISAIGLQNFTPGQLPDNFVDLMEERHYLPDSGLLSFERIQALLKEPATKIAHILNSTPLHLLKIAPHLEDKNALEKIAIPMHLSLNHRLGDSYWNIEEAAIKRQMKDGGKPTEWQLQSLMTVERRKDFALGASIALKDEDESAWETFLALGQGHTGSLKDLLRTCQALK